MADDADLKGTEPTTRRSQLAAQLSGREGEIARLLVEGYSTVSVGALMGLSEHTIRTYVRRIYGKLKVCNRVELTRALCL